jgi:hypothetical protein
MALLLMSFHLWVLLFSLLPSLGLGLDVDLDTGLGLDVDVDVDLDLGLILNKTKHGVVWGL